MNYWVVAFPCLMYFASVSMYPPPGKRTVTVHADTTDTATGLMIIYYEVSEAGVNRSAVAVNFDYPYFTISLSLNILLMLMIITRLILHSKKIQGLEAFTRTRGWCKTVAVTFIESYALYVVNFLLFVGTWCAGSYVADTFSPILTETQVRMVTTFS